MLVKNAFMATEAMEKHEKPRNNPSPPPTAETIEARS